MSRHGRPEPDTEPLPPLYAMTHSGLEPVAADEITRDLGGQVKKTDRGLVVFKLDTLSPDVLKSHVRTTAFSLPPERPKGRMIPGDADAQVAELVRLLRDEAKVL